MRREGVDEVRKGRELRMDWWNAMMNHEPRAPTLRLWPVNRRSTLSLSLNHNHKASAELGGHLVRLGASALHVHLCCTDMSLQVPTTTMQQAGPVHIY